MFSLADIDINFIINLIKKNDSRWLISGLLIFIIFLLFFMIKDIILYFKADSQNTKSKYRSDVLYIFITIFLLSFFIYSGISVQYKKYNNIWESKVIKKYTDKVYNIHDKAIGNTKYYKTVYRIKLKNNNILQFRYKWWKLIKKDDYLIKKDSNFKIIIKGNEKIEIPYIESLKQK